MKILCKSLVASLVLMGASHALAQQSEGTPVDGGTAVLAVGTDLRTLNAATTTLAAETTVGCMIHEGLIEIRGDGTYAPALAKSWKISDDGRTYTFDLVETTWHDGKPFTSKDVEYFMTSVAKVAPLVAAQVAGKISKTEILGEHKISVTLSEPYGPFLRMLACYNGGAMIPEHIYKGTDPVSSPASKAAIGTGPFKFVDWKSGDSIRLAKNEKYWGGKVRLDGVVIRIMPNAASRVQGLKTGEVDFIQKYYVPVSDVKIVQSDPNLKTVVSDLPPNMLIGFFNVTKKPFDDKRVRKALFSVIDRNFIRDAVFSGQGLPMQAPFPVQMKWAADPDINYDKMYPNDVAAANKALDDAGLAKGANGIRLKTSMIFESNVPERLKTATAIQGAWKQLGIEVELLPMENAVLLPRSYRDGNFDFLLISYNSYGDPAVGISRIWQSASIGRDYGNAARYSNPKVDELFAKAAALSSIEDRAGLYRQAQKILADELPVITLHENKGLDAATAKLNGVWGYEGNGHWSTAWLKK